MTAEDSQVKSTMDPGWEAALAKETAPGGERIYQALQDTLDEVSSEFAAHPVEEIRPALAEGWAPPR